MKVRILNIVLVIFFCCSINPHAAEWRLHPSFDRTPLRIIDTPENTYFLVHQQIYNKTLIGYDFPSLTLFQYDKNASDKGITPLVHDVSLSSADLRMADYSPKGEYLFVAYNDGGIDLIDKGKHLTHIDRLKRYTIPGMAKITSVSFDPSTGDAWVGTDAGYMHVDAGDFTIKDVKVFDRGIDRICRFGDKLVAISGNAAWQSEAINPFTFNEFKQISSVDSPSIMLPLADNEFAFVSGAPGATRTLKLARLEGGSWKVSNLGSDNFYSVAPNETLVNRYEANFIPNKDGYLIFSTSKAWQLYAPKNGEATKFVSISLDKNPVSLGSWDFSDFWAYRNRGTFVPRHAEYTLAANATAATATWTDTQSPIRPNAPAAFICTYMDYSPKYGLLAMNHGHDYQLQNTAMKTPVLLSSIVTNKWELLNQAYVSPNSVNENPSLKDIYSKNIDKFPIADPYGFLIDPLYTDWITCGSMFGGVIIQDISDLKKDAIHICSPNNTFNKFPGYISATPLQTWGTLSCFSNPSFDNDNTLWYLFCNMFERDGNSAGTQLKYLTADARNKLYQADLTELDKFFKWPSMDVETAAPSFDCKVLAGRHNINENKIFCFSAGTENRTIVYNHKGTLDNLEDDEISVFPNIFDKFSNKISVVRLNDVLEDESGNIIICATNGLYIVNPSTMICNETIVDEDKLGLYAHINKVALDSSGRLWIGTNNQGIIVVAQDYKSVLAKYDTFNSPLPSNCVYGFGWNPDSNSMMVSTRLGMAEVFPEVCSSSKYAEKPYLSISHVNPDYNGYIEIRNIMPNWNVSIRNSDGEEVIRLNNDSCRSIVKWDIKDKNGKKLQAGIYNVCVADENPLELVVMSN